MTTSTKLRLEPLSLDHLDGVMTWVNDPEVTFYFATLGHVTREQESAYIQKLIDSKSDIIYSIFEGDEYLGQIGISQIYWPARNGRIGVLLRRAAWGRGVAERAGRLLMAEAFLKHDLHKLWLIIRSDNTKSLHLWSKLGFRCEGILREEYYSQGKFHDMMRLASLSRDWLSE